MKSISILLGAGFSAPMGYPVGNDLNKKLLALDGTEFGFHSDGTLCIDDETGRPDWGYKTIYDIAFDFCLTLMKHFKSQRKYFNYEEFYDYFKSDAQFDGGIDSIVRPFVGSYTTKETLLYNLSTIYNQTVLYLLKDREGNQWYEDGRLSPNGFAYSNMKRCIEEFNKGNTINVHTLNHDLLFEALFKDNVSDGFEEQGSSYYGKCHGNGAGNVRLERYTGIYSKPLHLYKLHGSIDYYYHSSPDENSNVFYPIKYVKIKRKVDMNTLKREVLHDDDTSSYENAPPGYYHPDFLTGTTSKIFRYEEPLLYKKLFEHFEKNLQQAEKLIIIGYGGRDEKVNEMIFERFNSQEKTSYIIDPCPGDAIKALSSCLGAKLIEKQLEDITAEDLV